MNHASNQASSLSFLYHCFLDFDHFQETVEGWDLRWLQLERGLLRVESCFTHTGQVFLTHTRWNRRFEQQGAAPPGVLTFALPKPGTVPDWCSHRPRDDIDSLLIFPVGDGYHSVSEAGFDVDTISIDLTALQQSAEMLGMSHAASLLQSGPRVLEFAAGRLRPLRCLLQQVRGEMIQHPEVVNVETLCRTINNGLPVRLSVLLDEGAVCALPDQRTRRRAVTRARDIIAAMQDDSLTIQELCQLCNVSWRTLNYAFKEYLGVGPKQYLQTVRLHRVREQLLQGPGFGAIADISNRWGFWHMGQFARDYQRLFGELPSGTRRRVATPPH